MSRVLGSRVACPVGDSSSFVDLRARLDEGTARKGGATSMRFSGFVTKLLFELQACRAAAHA